MARSTTEFGKVAIAEHAASGHTISRESTTILNRTTTILNRQRPVLNFQHQDYLQHSPEYSTPASG